MDFQKRLLQHYDDMSEDIPAQQTQKQEWQ
jgi:hypothetical protein